MPVVLTAPGVYIEEIPSAVRTITGVPTSITAFLGRTPMGPVDTPTLIGTFGDFQRAFGGLAIDCPLTYAVSQFFQNGGSQALIVRAFNATGLTNNGVAQFTITGGGGGTLILDASSPGAWANKIEARSNYAGITQEIATQYGVATTDLFNLEIKYNGRTETIRNLTVADTARRVDRVLPVESNLVVAVAPLPNSRPMDTTTVAAPNDKAALTNGTDSAAGLDLSGNSANKTGLYALEKANLFNLLVIPPDTRNGNLAQTVLTNALGYCQSRRAVLLVDPPTSWATAATAAAGLTSLSLTGPAARNAAVYYPRIVAPDPLRPGQTDTFVASGAIAGVIATTDARRGVWKAPAGIDAGIAGTSALAYDMTDLENGTLNALGINGLRTFPVFGRVVWGARTARGADQLADEYKYLPVRRLALYIEESLYRGTQWVVFEPNDEPLWAQIRLNVGAFMHTLFRQGAFQGTTPTEAYLVKCDAETTTQDDRNRGVVNILVGFAPLKPAEFVIIQIQQLAGQIAT